MNYLRLYYLICGILVVMWIYGYIDAHIGCRVDLWLYWLSCNLSVLQFGILDKLVSDIDILFFIYFYVLTDWNFQIQKWENLKPLFPAIDRGHLQFQKQTKEHLIWVVESLSMQFIFTVIWWLMWLRKAMFVCFPSRILEIHCCIFPFYLINFHLHW